tara:strand:+ start:1741 stop:1872 length:132 start_codon:yes stop_codon:yes gene_type:complete
MAKKSKKSGIATRVNILKEWIAFMKIKPTIKKKIDMGSPGFDR